MSTILCVDDEPSVGVVLEHALAKIGHRPLLVSSVEDAMVAAQRTPIDLIIADYRMPKLTGLDLLGLLEKKGYRIPVIIMTEYASIEHAVISVKAGAVDYLTKPVRSEALEIAVHQALEVVRLRRENETLRREIMKMRSTRVLIGDGVEEEPFDLDEIERRTIVRALIATGGNRTRAAKLLGISERTLRNKLNVPRAEVATEA
jgi:DNA-binding NtrC family response regulator